MVSEKIVSLVGAGLILGAVATVVLVTQGHSPHREPVVRSESQSNSRALSAEPVPEAAKILYAQLSSIRHKDTDSKADKREVALHKSLGHVYQDSGNYPEAVRHYSLARDQAMQLGDSEQIVEIQTTLGSMHAATGNLQDARAELERAFLLMDRSGPNAFTTLRALANIRRDSGKVDEALTLYGETLRLQEQQTPVKRAFPVENVAGLLSDMGQAYHSKGQLDVAMSYYKQALDKMTDANMNLPTTGSAAKELGEIYNNIGQAYHEKGNLEQAGEYYNKAHRLQQRTLRENHPCVVETLINLARLKRDSGSVALALAGLAKAEALLKGRETHREFASILVVKADLLREDHQLTEAATAAFRALEIQESLGSGETPELAITLNGLGSILHDQHKYQDAVKQYMRALVMNMKTVGSNNPETAATYNNLGNVYQDAGDNDAAEKYYRKTLEIQREIYTTDNPDVAATYNNIATILVRQSRFAEAKELLQKAIDVVHKAGLPPGQPERAVYEENLAEVQQRLTASSQTQETKLV